MQRASHRTSRFVFVFIMFALVFVSPLVWLPSTKAEDKLPLGTTMLFDGKSLDGWKKTKFGGEGKVEIKNGELRLGTGESLTGVTSTRKNLPTTNYELSYEAMRMDGYDFFAAATFPVRKKEHATFINGGWGGGVIGISSIDGYDASENDTTEFMEFKNKKWYKYAIRVTAEKIQVLIDGKLEIDVPIKERELDTRIEVDLCKPLGFCAWESNGAIRNVKLRILSAEEVAKVNKTDE